LGSTNRFCLLKKNLKIKIEKIDWHTFCVWMASRSRITVSGA
jgi:hypothetical protein